MAADESSNLGKTEQSDQAPATLPEEEKKTDSEIEETKELEIPSIGEQVAYGDVKKYIGARGPDSQRLMTYSDQKWI